MPVVVAQVVQLVVGVLCVYLLVRAALPRRGVDEAAFLRRRAESLTAFFGLVVAYLTTVVVLRLTGPEGVNPLGVIPFFTLIVVVVVAVVTLRGAWRRALESARAAEEARPVVEDTPRPHRGLSGEDPPPRRW